MLTLLPCSDQIFDVGSGRSDSAIFQVYHLLYSFHSPKRGLIFCGLMHGLIGPLEPISAWPNRPIGGHREGLGQSIKVKQHCEALRLSLCASPQSPAPFSADSQQIPAPGLREGGRQCAGQRERTPLACGRRRRCAIDLARNPPNPPPRRRRRRAAPHGVSHGCHISGWGDGGARAPVKEPSEAPTARHGAE